MLPYLFMKAFTVHIKSGKLESRTNSFLNEITTFAKVQSYFVICDFINSSLLKNSSPFFKVKDSFVQFLNANTVICDI